VTDYFTDLVTLASARIQAGFDLELVIPEGENADSEHFLLGDCKVVYELVDLDELDDYIMNLTCVVGTYKPTLDAFREISTWPAFLVSAGAVGVRDNSFELLLTSDFLLTGNAQVDSVSLAARLDAIVKSRTEALRKF